MSLDTIHALHAKSQMPLGEASQTDARFADILLPEIKLENEIKFLVPDTKELRELMELDGLEAALIETSYLSDNLIPYALSYIIRHSEDDLSDCTPHMFSQARLRRIIPLEEGKAERYFIEVKGPKALWVGTKRGEEGVEIHEDTFKSMLAFVRKSEVYTETGFALKKRRTDYVFSESGGYGVLEIDKIKSAGVGEKFKIYKKKDWEYFEVGCEVPDDHTRDEIIAGKHDTAFLKHPGVILVTGNEELEGALSMKSTAKNGIKKKKVLALVENLKGAEPELVGAA